NVPAPRRHAVRPSLGNRLVDLRRRAAVDPLRIHQRRADAAAAVEVAAGAVVLVEELLPLADRVRVAFVRIVDRRGAELLRPRLQAADADGEGAGGVLRVWSQGA